MTDQFTDFKKCISWQKRFNAWCGTFRIENTEDRKGMCQTCQSAPYRPSREAKNEIAETLYEEVKVFCDENDINLNEVIAAQIAVKKQKLAAKKSADQSKDCLLSSA